MASKIYNGKTSEGPITIRRTTYSPGHIFKVEGDMGDLAKVFGQLSDTFNSIADGAVNLTSFVAIGITSGEFPVKYMRKGRIIESTYKANRSAPENLKLIKRLNEKKKYDPFIYGPQILYRTYGEGIRALTQRNDKKFYKESEKAAGAAMAGRLMRNFNSGNFENTPVSEGHAKRKELSFPKNAGKPMVFSGSLSEAFYSNAGKITERYTKDKNERVRRAAALPKGVKRREGFTKSPISQRKNWPSNKPSVKR